jgi:hypothetical protein
MRLSVFLRVIVIFLFEIVDILSIVVKYLHEIINILHTTTCFLRC